MDLCVGDVVRLKAGGPRMVVSSVEGEDVTCQWFDKDKKLSMNLFKKAVIDIDDHDEIPKSEEDFFNNNQFDYEE